MSRPRCTLTIPRTNESFQYAGISTVYRLNTQFVSTSGSCLTRSKLKDQHGKHTCLVYEPLGNSLGELSLLADGALEAHIIRQTMRPILTALQFLHAEARVIHTGGRLTPKSLDYTADLFKDLQPNNILLGIHARPILAEFEQEELREPSPRKELPDRTIYVSRPMPLAKGWPSLSDFSEARFGGSEHTDLVMPNVYRAPEVILDMPWSYPVDRWAFAMVIWDLFEPQRLFAAQDEYGQYSEVHHLAHSGSTASRLSSEVKQMPEILGPACLGNWIENVAIPDDSLCTVEKRLPPDDKPKFLDFMRKMLQWKPEERSDWDDIFFSEWLVADLIESGQIVRDGD